MAKKRRQKQQVVTSDTPTPADRKTINTQDVINRALVMATVDLHTPPGADATPAYSRCMEVYNRAASAPNGTHARGMEAVRAELTSGGAATHRGAQADAKAASFQARRATFRV